VSHRETIYRKDNILNDLIQLGPVHNDPQCGRPVIAKRRVVGGKEAGFGTFPWQALIRWVAFSLTSQRIVVHSVRVVGPERSRTKRSRYRAVFHLISDLNTAR
jgi:hypothetical protein